MSDSIQENPRGLLSKNLAKIFPTYIIGYENLQHCRHNQETIEYLETQEFTPDPHQPYQTIDNHLEKSLKIKGFSFFILHQN